MTVKQIHHKQSGKSFKLGRRRPISRGPRLSLKNYLTRRLAPPPATCDYSAPAMAALSQMYLNDTLGDCVIAGIGHVVGTLTSGAGDQYIYTSDQIVTLYEAIGGYNPDNPATDQGCDEVTALNYWENNGAPAGAHQIAGWLAVDATNPLEYRTALYLFENLYFGMELPDAWVQSAGAGAAINWDVAGPPDPSNGHCVVGVGYNQQGVTIATWGQLGTITDAAVAAYASPGANGALYTVVSQDALNSATSTAANGLDWSQLVADFDSMGGNVSNVSMKAPVKRDRR
jgi:hypothetical protein